MNDYRNTRVLVTGGAGFIGSHLVEDLVHRGSRVTVVDNLTTGHADNLAPVRTAVSLQVLDLATNDLRPLLAAEQFDLIFHLAANANLPFSVEHPRQDLERNTIATFNLLEAVREAAADTRFVHTSTAAVYGQGVRMPIEEGDPTVPVAPYGVSKLAAERYTAIYAQLYGLRTTSVRLFSVFGPRLRKQVVYDLMRKIRANPHELFIYGDGTQVRDFNHVTNIVEALLVVAERSRLEGEVYNVAAEEPVSVHDMACLLCEQMGVNPRFVYSGDVRPGEAQQWYADITRLKGLGYHPRVGLREGLADTVSWFHRDIASSPTAASP